MKKKIAILISGRGSNMRAIIDACANPDYPAQVVLVLSNKADALGLKYAAEKGIATQVVNHNAYNSREEFDAKMAEKINASGAEIVCLAGFMRVLSAGFVKQFEGRMINIHPSLLPKFKGLETHKRALMEQETQHGCTVHYVTAELDSGATILQEVVSIEPHDTEASLAAKVLAKEHGAYVKALAIVASK
jgi:phosphoribosylglycinamide formyltransferase-1